MAERVPAIHDLTGHAKEKGEPLNTRNTQKGRWSDALN
jgi:hypothetical protein